MNRLKPKNKKFRLFDSQRVGKGVSKSASQMEPGLKRFWITLKDNFGKIVSVNIFMVLGNFPLFFLIMNLSGVFKIPYFLPSSDLFQNTAGIFAAEGAMTPYKLALLGIQATPVQSLAPTAINYVFYGLSALSLLTFGCVNVGTAYILRNIASGEPVFVWSDFWYAVKRNWKQALPFGALDMGILALLGADIYLLVSGTSRFFTSLLFWGSVIVLVFYFVMRFYIYVQMVTFKMSVFKILKNSVIFALAGFKRNILAVLGIVVLVLLEMMFTFGSGGILLPLAVGLPLAVLFALMAYMKVYASYFKIKELIIDPYYKEHPEEAPGRDEEEEAVMTDDVTERERVNAIRAKNGLPPLSDDAEDKEGDE